MQHEYRLEGTLYSLLLIDTDHCALNLAFFAILRESQEERPPFTPRSEVARKIVRTA